MRIESARGTSPRSNCATIFSNSANESSNESVAGSAFSLLIDPSPGWKIWSSGERDNPSSSPDGARSPHFAAPVALHSTHFLVGPVGPVDVAAIVNAAPTLRLKHRAHHPVEPAVRAQQHVLASKR